VTDALAVPIRGDLIRLGQFLKVADAVDQGSDVKALLATRAVTVNGEVEVRRGRQLRIGDRIGVSTAVYQIVAPRHGDDDPGASPPPE
jgi:ribosome-associated protein